MLEFLRLLTPRHGDALRPASPVRRAASMLPDEIGNGWDAGSDVAAHATPMHGDEPPPATSQPQPVEPTPERGQQQTPMDPSRPALARSTTLVATTASPHTRLPPHPAQFIEPADVPRPTLSPLSRSPVIARRIDATGPMPSTAASSTNAPLSPASVALLAAAPAHASAPPALHINIDRIEVRAPAPAPKHAATRSRAAPATQSLSDYLGGRGRTTP